MNEKIFIMDQFLLSEELKDYSPDDIKQLQWIKTVNDCDVYLERHLDEGGSKLAQTIRKIKAGLQGFIDTNVDDFEWECYQALCRYEAARTAASGKKFTSGRLRRSGMTRAWHKVIDRIVSKPPLLETEGFKALRSIGRLDASFEGFVLRNPSRFSDKAVSSSLRRLHEANVDIGLIIKSGEKK